MKNFSVLLINPPAKKVIDQYDNPNFPNPTLAYLAAYVIKNGIECKIIDSKLTRLKKEDIVVSTELKEASLVGITSMTHEIKTSAELAADIKKKYENKKIVIGGPHATALPYETLEEFKSFDYLIYGEGEKPLLNLINALKQETPLDNIKGLSYRVGKQIIVNTDEDVIENMDEIPFPAYELFPKTKRYYIITARGCPYKCLFCYTKRNKIRFRSINKVMEDLNTLIKTYHPKTIEISDDSFNADRARTLKILNLMSKNKFYEKTKFIATVHAKTLDYSSLTGMKQAGFTLLKLGIESGNNDILRATGKGITKEIIRQVTKDARKIGIKIQGLYILGLPNETWQTALDTIKFAIKLNTEEIALACIVPYPGTEIWNLAKKNLCGYKNLSKDWEKYSKYFGSAIELGTLNRAKLKFLQITGYLGLYLCNFKFVSIVKYSFLYKREIFLFIFKMFTTSRKLRKQKC